MSWKVTLSESLQKGDLNTVVTLTKEQVESGERSEVILSALLDGMDVIGRKFKNNEIFVPEVLIAARAMNGGLEILAPILEAEGVESLGTAVIGTVVGDLHDIGKNLVKMMLIGAGLDVVDLGVDVSPQKFVDAIETHHPNIVAMSALLTTTMPAMEKVIQAIEKAGLRDQVKIMIGGAPVTEQYAQEIGADRYTADAGSAAEVAKALVS